ncbi:MAG: hypothetical protein DRH10_09375, partial [Deltaproteobacteria bacterium]
GATGPTSGGDLLRDVRGQGPPLDLDQERRFEGIEIHAPYSGRAAVRRHPPDTYRRTDEGVGTGGW